MKRIFSKTIHSIACCAAVLLLAACEQSGDLPEPTVKGSDRIYLDFSPGGPGAPMTPNASGAASKSGAAGASGITGASGASAAAGASGGTTRTLKDDAMESKVETLDVLIFEVNKEGTGPGIKKHYERISRSSRDPGSTKREALAVKRSDFAEGVKYWVYLIANANDEEREKFATMTKGDELKASTMTRTDLYIHLTGLPNDNSADITLPQTFLMDGVAYVDTTNGGEILDETDKPVDEPTTPGPVVLNDGVRSHNTYLAVILRRAAVKLQLKIKKGDDITFWPPEGSPSGSTSTGGYYLRNMPYTTSIVKLSEEEEKEFDQQVRTTQQSRNSRYIWEPNQITVIAYVYSHRWEAKSAVENEPRWILDIPLTYTSHEKDENGNVIEGEPKEYPHCYYQIPVCAGNKLQRNTWYTVSLTLNIPGGNDPAKPLGLEGLQYEVAPWTSEKFIPVGGEDDHPMFLTVNRDEMEMHETDVRTDEEGNEIKCAVDETTLRFASSSPVSVAITKVYFEDKFGQVQTLEKKFPDDPNDNTWGTKTVTKEWVYVGPKPWNYEEQEVITWSNECEIRVIPDAGVSGKIAVYSDTPTNKTIRYIEIAVTNKDGVEARTVKIKQYPLEYITNIQSWYSYRDDFKINDSKPTTYEYAGDRVYGISLNSKNISSWTGGYTYEIPNGYGAENGFFRSKYAVMDEETGKSRFYNYYYDSNNRRRTSNSGEYNARLYRINLTASSNTYTIGRPRQIIDKVSGLLVTDPGPDNALLVSPSFMIASSLSGFMANAGNLTMDDSQNTLRVCREHCAHYVEVYQDENDKSVVLDDWRMPTKAELEIILKYQGSDGEDADAIDYLLNGSYYYHAGGRVYNANYTVNAGEVRCVRDVFNDPTASKAVDPAAGNQ